MDLGELIPRNLITTYGLNQIFGGADDGDKKDGDKDKKKAKAAKVKKKPEDDEDEKKRYDWWGVQTSKDAWDELTDVSPGLGPKTAKLKKKAAKKKPETPEED